MKNKIFGFLICAMVVTTLAVTGCGNTSEPANESNNEESQGNNMGMINPWVESDSEGVLAATGFSFDLPEGASEIGYSYSTADGMAQVDFVMNGTSYTYRIVSASEFTDISGLYFDWTDECDGKVSYCDSKEYSFISSEEDDVMSVLWYDQVPGAMYSLSAMDSDLDGLDLGALANQIFQPLQGDS